jgi:hypothetical protein
MSFHCSLIIQKARAAKIKKRTISEAVVLKNALSLISFETADASKLI